MTKFICDVLYPVLEILADITIESITMMSVVTDSYKRHEGYWYPATECGRESWRWEGALMTHLQTPFSSPAISVVPAKPFVASGAVNQLAANLQSDDLLWWSPSRKGLPTTGSLCSRIGTKGLSKPIDGIFEHHVVDFRTWKQVSSYF